MEESALIVRMKFTCKPGEQWAIRREAYARVRDALQQAGIHFAHREVRAHLPGAESVGPLIPPATPLSAAAGAAAGTVVLADELKRQDRIDDEQAGEPGADEDSL